VLAQAENGRMTLIKITRIVYGLLGVPRPCQFHPVCGDVAGRIAATQGVRGASVIIRGVPD